MKSFSIEACVYLQLSLELTNARQLGLWNMWHVWETRETHTHVWSEDGIIKLFCNLRIATSRLRCKNIVVSFDKRVWEAAVWIRSFSSEQKRVARSCENSNRYSGQNAGLISALRGIGFYEVTWLQYSHHAVWKRRLLRNNLAFTSCCLQNTHKHPHTIMSHGRFVLGEATFIYLS
jgi:hypothetical protein